MSDCCENPDLKWFPYIENNSGVQDGRLRIHDLSVSFFLGCECCSATVKTIDGYEAATLLPTNNKE